MPKRILQLLLTLVMTGTPAQVEACLWLHGTTIEGHYERVNKRNYGSYLTQRVTERPTENARLFALHHYSPDDPVAAANDDAVKTLLRGDAARAVAMLEAVEAKTPGAYNTAANLGTAYELAGNDEKALEWILKGIERNPASHMYTEWLHARVLEAKLALKKDPAWFASHTISGVDFARLIEPGYELATRQKPVNARALAECLHSHLSVRMLFVKPQDPIVAQLLCELARVESQVGFLEQALTFANLAEQYGLEPAKLAAERKTWNEIIRNTPPYIGGRFSSDWWIAMFRLWFLLAFLASLFLYVLLRFWFRTVKRSKARTATLSPPPPPSTGSHIS